MTSGGANDRVDDLHARYLDEAARALHPAHPEIRTPRDLAEAGIMPSEIVFRETSSRPFWEYVFRFAPGTFDPEDGSWGVNLPLGDLWLHYRRAKHTEVFALIDALMRRGLAAEDEVFKLRRKVRELEKRLAELDGRRRIR